MIGDDADERRTHDARSGQRGVEDAHRLGAPAAGEIIPDERHRTGRTRSLPRAEPGPGDRQLDEVGGRSRREGHERPDRDRPCQDVPADSTVQPARDRNTERDIRDDKRGAGKQSELGIGQLEVGLDLLQHDADRKAVDVRENVDEPQHKQRVVGLPSRDFAPRCLVHRRWHRAFR